MAFFEQVPAQSNMAYVVILHLSPDFDSQLAQILQTVTSLPVIRVNEPVKVQADHVYIVSPNRHLRMQDGELIALTNTHLEERRAPVDIFFRTLAETHQSKAIAVVLSGTGANGSMGLKRVKEKGGAVFVQSPQQAAFAEMPRQAIATDLVDEVLAVENIPAKLVAYCQGLGTVTISLEADQRPQQQQQALREVFAQLRLRTGHDFSNYKRPTLLRRIERRIHVHNLPDLPAYTAYLHEHVEETEALLKDLLISVTNFFRDPAVFIHLETQVLPRLLEKKNADDTLRIWVAGCATGEEAYSLAMLCIERTQGVIDAPKVQIFATDLDEDAIATAREGLYTLNDAADVSPERLRRFFSLEGDRYRISREIREMVLFAHHNALKDPPFSRLDLVSCRNLLIYFNYTAQEQILETFHFALNPGGYLVLGLAETADSTKDLYASLSREHHLYQSRLVTSRRYPIPKTVPPRLKEQKPASPAPASLDVAPTRRMNYGDLHQRLLVQNAPPSVVINEEYDILHFTDRAGRYLHFSGGEPSHNLLKLIRPELRLELRTALYQATQEQSMIEVRGLTLRLEERTETLTLHVRPVLDEGDPARGYFLVLFETTSQATSPAPPVLVLTEPMARQLEAEVIRVKNQLRSTNEQHDQQAEILKASNEELQAMNEELRSAAEELETSKEELQSINEELSTVNQELKVKIEEVSLSSDNLRNLINSTNIATLFVDRSLRVNLFTPAAQEIFNLIPSDYGRPLTDITHRLNYQQLVEDAQAVLSSLQPLEREVTTTSGRSFILRILPYRTADDRINGLVLTFVDISQRQAAEESLRKSEEQFRLFVITSSNALYKMSPDWTIMYQLQGTTFLADTEQPNRSWLDQYIPLEDQVAVQATIREAIDLKKPFDFEHRVIRRDGGLGWTLSRAIPLFDDQGAITEWFGAASDISPRKQAEEKLSESERRLRLAIEATELATWDWNLLTNEVYWNEQHFQLFGMSPRPNPVTPEDFLSHVHPDDRDRLIELLQQSIASRDTYDAEFCTVLENGSQRWMSGYGRVVEEVAGQPTRMSGVMLDVTNRRQAEEDLREANRRKDEFLALLAHELRNPMATLSNALTLLETTGGTDTGLPLEVVVPMMSREVSYLVRMVDDLLDISRINLDKIELRRQRLELNTLVDQVQQVVRPLVEQAHQQLRVQGPENPLYVEGDAARLIQVLRNLLGNAIKFTPSGGVIDLFLDQVDQRARLRVVDSGIGLAQDELRRIFSLFAQVNTSHARSQGGLGLGLTLVQSLVCLHGGQVEARSPGLGLGSEFIVYLPLVD